MPIDSNLNDVIGVFANKTKEIFGDTLKDLILFGSYARGEQRTDSDVDIMIVADVCENTVMNYINKVSEVASDISLEYDVFLSPIIEPLTKYEKYKDIIPFLQVIQREGIHIGA